MRFLMLLACLLVATAAGAAEATFPPGSRIGLKPPKERLDKAIKLSSFKVLKEQERRHGFIEKSPRAQAFFREGKAEQWRKVLTHAQVAAIVAAHREQMTRFGYVPPGF